MKILLSIMALVAFSFITPPANDPLRNTRWETPDGLVFYFTPSDTVKLIMDNKVLTFAQYKVKDSLVIWRDFVKSDATCDTSIRGTYIYTIKDSLLSFRVLSDRCEQRANVIPTLVLARDRD